jgi:hypothetical protein
MAGGNAAPSPSFQQQEINETARQILLPRAVL